jgi:arylsulfatase A-like enzyme
MAARPDILWIVTTQWRAQALGSAGDVNARTPNLDALAAQAMNHTQAITPHPFGPFARAAMLTGLPSPENGVRDYFDPLPKHARTIAHALNPHGYGTAFFGKWHLASRDPKAPLVGDVHAKQIVPPDERGGFGFWEGFESGFLLNDPWLHGSGLPHPKQCHGYQSDVVCGRAANWLGERYASGDRAPWFAIVSLEPPHPPYGAPAAGVRPGQPAQLVLAANVPRGGPVEAQARDELAGYYAHIEATDRAIGALVDAVDRRAREAGRTRPTILFTSVHGDMHGAHGLFRKGWPHEESIRVPLLIRKSETGATGRSDETVSLLDLAAMTLDWAGVAKRPASQHWARISMPSVVALKHQCDRIWQGIRTKSRKAIWLEDGSPWLYFDLERDPAELNNLASDPARRSEFDSLRTQGNANPRRHL